jgi:tetratricopeptide (TPR) repeat protein
MSARPSLAALVALVSFVTFVTSIIAPAQARAAEFTVAPAQGRELALLKDAQDGKLDSMDLLDAALVASGVPDVDLAATKRRVRDALAPAIARAKERSGAARGKALLGALHESVFRKYAQSATDVAAVVTTGEYNCLSSALLYVIAAEGLLDQPRGMVSKRHAFARVSVAGKNVDVETTSPNGFGADRDQAITRELIDRIRQPNESRDEVERDMKNPEELPLLSLVAAVYSNRSVALVEKGDLAAAATALDRATHLATGQARARFASWRASVINTGAVALMKDGRLDDAQALLELARDGTTGDVKRVLDLNLGRVHLQKADAHAARSDWGGALAELDAARALGIPAAEEGNLRTVANGRLAAQSLDDARCTALGKAPETASCLAQLVHALIEKNTGADRQKALALARKAHALTPQGKPARQAVFFALQALVKEKSAALACSDVDVLVGEMDTLKDVVAGQPWSANDLTGSCWAQLGNRAYDAKDWDAASRSFTRARALLPDEKALGLNLARVDYMRALALSKDQKCDDARPLVRRAVAGDPALAKDGDVILESCANNRAVAFAEKREWQSAARELRRGLTDVPASEVLQKNLGAMLTNIVQQSLRAQQCDEARALATELRAMGREDTVAIIEQRCAR